MTHVSNLMKRVINALTWFSRSIQAGRQREANIEIARMLQNTEYRRESVDTVFNALCNNDLSSLRGYPLK